MKISYYAKSLKFGLFFLGITLAVCLLTYSSTIVRQLRNDNRNIVTIFSKIIAKSINDDSDENFSFVFNEIIKKVQFPIIYSDTSNAPIYSKNLKEELTLEDLRKIIISMDSQNNPISITYKNPLSDSTITLGYLHYGDSSLIAKLQWLPFIEISIGALFILLGFTGFNSVRKDEKTNIWVGMARETAHQLGTPISALMGWTDRIKNHPEDSLSTALEMEKDLDRLKQICDRFSKIGSQVSLENFSLNNLVKDQTVYLKKRLPSLGKDINLSIFKQEEVSISGDKVLLSWALENVIRNAIDSIKNEKGKVSIVVSGLDKFGLIKIKDNGIGIPKKNWKQVFRPGFSTKMRGWGLGLSLVNRIIEEIHNGKIKVLSSGSAGGTVFEIKLKKSF